MRKRIPPHPSRTLPPSQALLMRQGMTLVEVLVALVILSGTMLGIASYMTKFVQTVSTSDLRATATELASSRIEEIKNAPRYTAIDSMYAVTETFTEPRYKGFTRTTVVNQTGGADDDDYDYKTITVIVNNPQFASPVRKTSVIAAY